MRLEEEARNAAQREAARLARERKLKEVRRQLSAPFCPVKTTSPLTCWLCTEAPHRSKSSASFFFLFPVLLFVIQSQMLLFFSVFYYPDKHKVVISSRRIEYITKPAVVICKYKHLCYQICMIFSRIQLFYFFMPLL